VTRWEATLELIQGRAEQLVSEDEAYLRALVSIRKKRGESVETIAERMGVLSEQVRELESYYADPRLSTLRRYAIAVGAQVTHRVDQLPEISELIAED
jgi:transcriptional regulator with XRE-family HTH domain